METTIPLSLEQAREYVKKEGQDRDYRSVYECPELVAIAERVIEKDGCAYHHECAAPMAEILGIPTESVGNDGTRGSRLWYDTTRALRIRERRKNIDNLLAEGFLIATIEKWKSLQGQKIMVSVVGTGWSPSQRKDLGLVKAEMTDRGTMAYQVPRQRTKCYLFNPEAVVFYKLS